MKYKIILAVSTLLLASCNSFNRFDVYGDINVNAGKGRDERQIRLFGIRTEEPVNKLSSSQPQVTQPAAVKEKIVYRTPKGWCPQFEYPKSLPMPEVPSDEFEKIPRENVEERMRLMFSHIQTLRSTMYSDRENMRNAYEDYLKHCTQR